MTAASRKVHGFRFVLFLSSLFLITGLVHPPVAAAAISFVQVNSANPRTSQSTVSAVYKSAQTAGNTNIVVVGWGDTGHAVVSVTDTKGNVYTPAVGLTVNTNGGISQTIYYAKGIVAATANSNTVTATLNGAVAFPDIRILEYSGIDPTTPIDVTSIGTGSGTTSTTPAVATTNSTDMLFAANVVSTKNTAAGSGFTNRVISADGNIAEDRMVSATGNYSATAALSNGQWVAQMVAFRAAGSLPDTTPPSTPSNLNATAISATQINLSWTASTDNVGVTGYKVERCQGSTCSDFAQILTPTGTSVSDTTVLTGTTYSYRVRATDAAGNLSSYSNTATTTTPAPDIVPPSAPTNLNATAASGTQVNLTWTASTDNVAVTGYRIERCLGAGCSNFAQVSTSVGPSATDTGLTNATSYSYRVLAVDGAGNLSGYSNVATTTTLDTAAPTAPSGLSATAAGSTQINLSWTASTDNVGVTAYLVERCQGASCTNFVQVLAPTTTSVSDTGLTASTAYRYRVRARDAAGNMSGYSAIATATTASAPDTTPPSAPSNLAATAPSGTQVNLTWTASTDNVGVTGYLVERCQEAGCSNFAQVLTPTGTSVSDTGLTSGTSYSYRVRATDAAGNFSGYSNVATITPTADTTPPTAPSNLGATAVSTSQINLTWTAAADDIAVTGYRVERCQGAGCSNFAQVLTPTGTSVSDTGLTANTSYSYRVRATDAAGNLGAYSGTATATTFIASGTISFVQVKGSAPHSSQSTVSVAYTNAQTAGNANVVVIGWGDTTQTVQSVTDTKGNVYAPAVGPTINTSGGLSQIIYYATNIAAATAGGNSVTVTFSGAAAFPDIRILEYSGVDTVTPIDVVSSTTGSGATSSTPAVATTNAVDLLFGANVVATTTSGAGSGFTSRLISTDGNIVEDRTVSATGSYSATATLNSGQWLMQMVAFRAAGSPPPPPDTIPPTTPGSLTTTVLGTQINLTWAASTDNVAVTGYRLERCQGAGCSNFAQVAAPTNTSFADTGLSTSTSYSYRVRAIDAAGNLSGYSNTSTATTASAASNPIVVENQQTGSSAWQVGFVYGKTYADDTAQQIKGYASTTSINKGESIAFHVSVNPAQTYTVDVYRLGWYGGLGGRLMQHIGPLNGVQEQRCPINSQTGMIECNWSVGYTLQTQTSWTSGIYLAVLKNAQNFYNYIVFCVRDDNRVAALLYQQPVTTYQAYNNYPDDGATGKSLYEINSVGPNTMAGTTRAVKVSFDRPYADDGAGTLLWLSEMNSIRWLERSGYDVTYSTNLDTHENGQRIVNYRGFVSVPHDEYWSRPMYDAVFAARDAGVNMAFLGSNSIFWQIRLESSSSGVADRVVVCYKDANLDPVSDSTVKTVEWRQDPVNRAEQQFLGVEFTDGPNSGTASYVVTNSSNWVYAGTGLTDGTVIPGIVWYETDRQVAGDPLPNTVPGTYVLLSHSPYPGSQGPEYSNSSIYQAPSGAWVFASGTHGWGWGLDNYYPEGSVNTVDARIQKATSNVLDRFGGR